MKAWLAMFLCLVPSVPVMAAGQRPGIAEARDIPAACGNQPMHRSGSRIATAITFVDGIPTVGVVVNGRGSFRFAVDTGQPFGLSVSPDRATAMGLRRGGEMKMGDPSGRETHSIPIFCAASVSIGGVTFANVDAPAAAMRRRSSLTIDGTIGMGLFKGLLLGLDYGRARLTAKPGALPAAKGSDIVDATIDEMGLISIPIRIGDGILEVDLDTGNGRSALFMPTTQIASLPTSGVPRQIGVAHTISQEISLRAVDLAAPVRVGSTLLPVTSVAYPSVRDQGNLGSLGLVGTSVLIDVANRRVKISRG